MIKAVAEKGNPHLGENIYRKKSILCLACHAIGGAGPEIGPDLMSIGASAPVDYLIDSLLLPSKKIKEGYHMTMVSTKDGKMIAGSEVSANKDEVLIRDAAGKTTKIPTRNIKSKDVNAMSMMPPGLTATLSKEEFIHLVSFLSQLGKEGDFKTSSRKFVRTIAVAKKMHRSSWRNLKGVSYIPAYAKVDGSIPIEEKGFFPSPDKVFKFDIEVLKEGTLTLKLSSIDGVTANKITQEKITINNENKTAAVKVDKGKTSIVIILNKNFKAKDLKIEILDSETSAAVKLR